MPAGRRPQPDALKRAKGNPGKRRLASAAAKADAEVAAPKSIKPPSKLTASALAVWNQTAPDLERMNFLRVTDSQAFARYCDAIARFWTVRQKLAKTGVTYWTDSAHGKMQRINPLFIIEERLSKRLTDLEDRFGLTPASRQQIMLRMAQYAPQLPFGQPVQPQGKDGGSGETPPPPESPIGLLASSKLH